MIANAPKLISCLFAVFGLLIASCRAQGEDFRWNASVDAFVHDRLVIALVIDKKTGTVDIPRTDFVLFFYGDDDLLLGYDILMIGPALLKPVLHRYFFNSKYPGVKKLVPKAAVAEGKGLNPNLIQSTDSTKAPDPTEIDCARGPKGKDNRADWERELDQKECERKRSFLFDCQWNTSPQDARRCLDEIMGKEKKISPSEPDCGIDVNGLSLLKKAGVVVVGEAGQYATAKDPIVGHPQLVVFRTIEVLKGTDVPSTFSVDGSLVDADDFNSSTIVPYELGRGADRDCYIKTYRTGARYLLLMDSTQNMSPYWAPRAPTSEQLHDQSDPWLRWVRAGISQIHMEENTQKQR